MLARRDDGLQLLSSDSATSNVGIDDSRIEAEAKSQTKRNRTAALSLAGVCASAYFQHPVCCLSNSKPATGIYSASSRSKVNVSGIRDRGQMLRIYVWQHTGFDFHKVICRTTV